MLLFSAASYWQDFCCVLCEVVRVLIAMLTMQLLHKFASQFQADIIKHNFTVKLLKQSDTHNLSCLPLSSASTWDPAVWASWHW